jgi:hypothetical protein
MSRIRTRLDAFTGAIEQLDDAFERGIESHSALETLKEAGEAAEPLQGMAEELRALERSWKDRADREFLEFEDRLRRECQARTWRLDGQWPTFYVQRAISVVVDEQQRTVTVSEDKLQHATVEMVVRRLESMVADLLPRAFSAQTFMSSLAKAYDRIRAGSTQIPLLNVYRQMVCDQQKPKFWRNARTDAFVGLSIEQFRARLSSALEQGVTAASDRRELRMLPPIDPSEAVFLYQPAEARFGFVGRIEFLAADRGGQERK